MSDENKVVRNVKAWLQALDEGTDFQCDSAWELRRWSAQEVA